MALQSSGAISLNDMAGEFGGSTPHSLIEYYDAADGIPSSGTISMSDFYGASAASIPTSVNFWVVGGGGGGGKWEGLNNGGGGGGAGGDVTTGSYSSISSGETFGWVIGAGGAADASGGQSRVYATGRSNITGEGGGHGAGRTGSGGASSAGCSGGGSRYRSAGSTCMGRTQGAGGSGIDGLSTNMVDVHAGGGGGGANNTTGGNASVNFLNQAISGDPAAGLTFSTGVSSSLVLGKGGEGGVSYGARGSNSHGAGAVAFTSGFTALNSTAGETNRGGGGGGGANHNYSGSNYSTKAASAGGSGVVIMQYLDSGLGPTSITGSYTLQQVDGYRTYIFTSTGSLTW